MRLLNVVVITLATFPASGQPYTIERRLVVACASLLPATPE
jgi:hypothetical protein